MSLFRHYSAAQFKCLKLLPARFYRKPCFSRICKYLFRRQSEFLAVRSAAGFDRRSSRTPRKSRFVGTNAKRCIRVSSYALTILGDRRCKKAPSNGSIRQRAMGSSGPRAETRTCSSTSPPLNALGSTASTRDNRSSTSSSPTAARHPRKTSRSPERPWWRLPGLPAKGVARSPRFPNPGVFNFGLCRFYNNSNMKG